MTIQVDRNSEVPLYRQIFAILRHRILTGALAPGTHLPSVRQAEKASGVHHHTVGRAYRELSAEGLVESRRGVGTRVLSPRPGALTFKDRVHRFVEEVEELYGFGPAEIRRVLGSEVETPAERSRTPLWVVECSVTLSTRLARLVSDRWAVDARGWPLQRLATIPDGPVLGTHFHSAEIAGRLGTASDGTLEFVGIQSDPGELSSIVLREGDPIRELRVYDRDPRSGHGIVDDFRRMVGTEIPVEMIASGSAGDALAECSWRTPVVFSPGSWDSLSPEERGVPGAYPLPVRFNPCEEPVIGAFVEALRSGLRSA